MSKTSSAVHGHEKTWFISVKKKGTKKKRTDITATAFRFGGFGGVTGRSTVAVLGDQQASLPSSLLPWGQCVSCCSVPPGLHVHISAVYECF